MKYFIQHEFELGNLTKEKYDIYKKIEEGIKPSEEIEFYEKCKKLGIDLISQKTVMYDFNINDLTGEYHKESKRVLTKNFTSMWDGKKWVAIPARIALHNKRVFMEKNGIDVAVPASSSKRISDVSKHIDYKAFSNPNITDEILEDDFKFSKDGKNHRLQVLNNSHGFYNSKLGTQFIQFILSELPKTEANQNNIRETNSLLSDIRNRALQRASQYINKVSVTEDSIQRDITEFVQKVFKTAIDSGVDSGTLAYLEASNDKTDFKYNINSPNIETKLMQYFMTHFSKGVFSTELKGRKFTLASPRDYYISTYQLHGREKIADIDMIKANPSRFDTNQINHTKLKHRPLKWMSVDNNFVAEVVMTKSQADLLNLRVGDEISSDLFSGIGYRIPTQSHHSMVIFKVVEFLPEYYGDTIIVPEELFRLSGADLDIDSLFTVMKDYYIREGKPYVYGKAVNDEDKYFEYVQWEEDNNKYLQAILKNLQRKSTPKQKKDLKNDVIKYNEILFKALNLAGLPGTFEEWKKAGSPESVGSLGNKLIDKYMEFLRDPVISESLNTPATTELFEEDAKELSQYKNEVLYAPHYSEVGISSARSNNMEGKQLVAPTADTSKVGAWALTNDLQLNNAFHFKLNGKVYDTVSNLREDDVKIIDDALQVIDEANRVAATSSDSVSSATDNAKKNGLMKKLNLNMKTIGPIASLYRMGVGHKTAHAIATQPVLVDIGQELLLNEDLRAFMLIEESKNRYKQALKHIGVNMLAIADENLRKEVELFYNEYNTTHNINYLDLIKSLNHTIISDIHELSDQDKANQIKSDIIFYHSQLKALEIFEKMGNVSTAFSNINILLSLNKEFVSTYQELKNIDEAYNKLTNDPKLSKIFNNIKESLDGDIILVNNLKNKKTIENLLKPYFIKFTDVYQQLYNYQNRNQNNDKKIKNRNLNSELYKFLVFKAFLKVKNIQFKGSASYNGYLSLLYNQFANTDGQVNNETIVDKFLRIRAYPQVKDNKFIAYTKYRKPDDIDNKTGFAILELVTANKFSDRIVELLHNGFSEIWNIAVGSKAKLDAGVITEEDFNQRKDIQDFAHSLINYLILKDGLEFKPTSLVRAMPPGVLLELYDVLEMVHTAFLNNTTDELYGEGTQQLIEEFNSRYYQDSMNSKFMKIINDGNLMKYTNDGKIGWNLTDVPTGITLTPTEKITTLNKNKFPTIISINENGDVEYPDYLIRELRSDSDTEYVYYKLTSHLKGQADYQVINKPTTVYGLSNIILTKPTVEHLSKLQKPIENYSEPNYESDEYSYENEDIYDGEIYAGETVLVPSDEKAHFIQTVDSNTIPEDKLGEWYELISDFINKPVTREEFNNIKQKYSEQPINKEIKEDGDLERLQLQIDDIIENLSNLEDILADKQQGIDYNIQEKEVTRLKNQLKDLQKLKKIQEQPVNKEIKPKIDSSKKINIYAGTNENAELSNLASRPFRFNYGASYTDYNNVEQAFQAAKRDYSEESQFNTNLEERILNTENGYDAKKLGRLFKGFDGRRWDENSSRIMKKFILESFKQNPKALEILLATGNAELTHTQDKGKWGTEFPKLLMEVRNELKDQPNTKYQLLQDTEIEEFVASEEDVKKAKEELQKIIPNVSAEVISDYVDVIYSKNSKAIGKFENGLITLSKKSKDISRTAKHEAFHAVFAALEIVNPKLYNKILDEGSKKYGIKRGESKVTVKYSTKQQNEINYILKSVEILKSSKADEVFRKGDKNNWEIDKILIELAIPKEQKELIKSFGTRNREEILTSLLANYNYTVEINTAKNKIGSDTYGRGYEPKQITDKDFATSMGAEVGDYLVEYITEDGDPDIRTFKTLEEANQAFQTQRSADNSSVYSNLTVPGGTNYTENEISTPLITPSIKGHAQFATDNGIGWFRSDEKVLEDGTELEKEFQEALKDGRIDRENYDDIVRNKYKKFTPAKTRRILEVQSDLFQKGRDRKDLVQKNVKGLLASEPEGNTGVGIENPVKYQVVKRGDKYSAEALYEYPDAPSDLAYSIEQGDNFNSYKEFNTKEEADKYLIELKDKIDDIQGATKNSNKNQFLQLLNKNSNWVTFFVKSIIQDSAKKGYEKVLFPSGNTASKVEGHATLEEFRRQKVDRLNFLEEILIKEKQYALKEKKKYEDYEDTSIERVYEKDSLLSNYNLAEEAAHNTETEVKQLKEELSRVETEGFGALKPIYNFYENTVINILKKQFGKIQDYSNTPIKNGVDNLFEENKELAKIGSKQQYSAYLDTIFPDSKVKDIGYHGTDTQFEKFDKSLIGKESLKTGDLGIFFSDDKEVIEQSFLPKRIISSILNIKTPNKLDWQTYMENILDSPEKINKKGYDGIIGEKTEESLFNQRDKSSEFAGNSFIVFEPEQIHILGSKQDIEGFKEFVKESSKPKVPQITDEYGNTWNEIVITQQMSAEAIKFSSPDIKYTGDLAIEEKLADEYSDTKTTYSNNIFTKFFQWLKDMIALIRNKSDIDKLFRDINAGRFRDVSIVSKAPLYSLEDNEQETNDFLPFEDFDLENPDLSMSQGDSADAIRTESLAKVYNNLTKLLKSRINSLESLKGADASKRLDLNTRIKSLKANIEKIKTNISYDNMLSVIKKMLTVTSTKIHKNPDISDLTEAYSLLTGLSEIQSMIEDVFLDEAQQTTLGKLRAKILELQKIIDNTFIDKIQEIAHSYNLNYTTEDIRGAYKDINTFTSNVLSEYDSDLPELKIASLLFDRLRLNKKEDVIAKKAEAAKLLNKLDIKSAVQKIFDNGKLITKISPEYYENEHELLLRIGKKINELKNEFPFEERTVDWYADLRNLEEERIKWYLDNNDFEFKAEFEERWKIDEENQKDALKEEDGTLSAEGLTTFKKWVEENNPYAAMKMIEEYQKSGILLYNSKHKKWYKYLSDKPKAKWENPLYEDVKDDVLYNFIVNTIVEAQSDIPHKEVLERTSFDRLLKEFVLDTTKDPITAKAVLTNMQEFVSNLFTSEVTPDTMKGLNKIPVDDTGRELRKIKHKNLSDLVAKDPEQVINSILIFYEFAKSYKYKSEITPLLNLLTINLSKRDVVVSNILGVHAKDRDNNKINKKPGSDFESNALKLLKFAIISKIYDKTRLDEDSVIMSKKAEEEYNKRIAEWEASAEEAKRTGKPIPPKPTTRAFSPVNTVDTIVDWTRLSTLSLKPFTSISNLLIGLNANFIHAARKTDFDDKSLLKGIRLLTNNVIKYWTKDKIVTKEAEKIFLIADKFGAVDNTQEEPNLQNRIVKFLYTWQTSGEFIIHMSGLLAKLNHVKVTNLKGESKPLYNAFTVVDGSLQWNTEEFGEQPEWTDINYQNSEGVNKSKLFRFQREFEAFRKMTQGNYTDSMLFKGDWYGRVLMLFRTWLPQAIEQRFGSYRAGDEFTREFMGRYKSYKSVFDELKGNTLEKSLKFLGLTALALVPGTGTLYKNLTGLSKEIDIQNMRANIRELQLILGFILLVMVLKQLDDDEDDTNLAFLINLAQRAYQDLGFFYSPANAQNVLRDIIPIMKTVNDTFDVIDAGTNLITNPKEDIYKKGIRKGNSKFVKEASELFPVLQSVQSTLSAVNQTYGEKSYKYNK